MFYTDLIEMDLLPSAYCRLISDVFAGNLKANFRILCVTAVVDVWIAEDKIINK